MLTFFCNLSVRVAQIKGNKNIQKTKQGRPIALVADPP